MKCLFSTTLNSFSLLRFCSVLSALVCVFLTGSERAYSGPVYYEKVPANQMPLTVPAATSTIKEYSVNKGPAGEPHYKEAEKYRLRKDYKRAEVYYSKAAELGYGMAHFRLGQMYATGRGSVRSLVDAHMHYNLSSYLGVSDGRSAMLVLEEQMSEDQIEKAMQRAVRYRAYHDL